jgi:hypothetical protein
MMSRTDASDRHTALCHNIRAGVARRFVRLEFSDHRQDEEQRRRTNDVRVENS